MNRFIRSVAATCMCVMCVPAAQLSAQHGRLDSAAASAAGIPTATPPVATVTTEREIALGETRVGTLITGDPTLDDGEYYHVWVFNGRADDRIVVTLRSTAFDGYLAIFTEDGEWEEQDDDSGGDSNARLDVTLPATGRYAIIVTSYAGGEKGEYSLSVQPHEPDGSIARGSTK